MDPHRKFWQRVPGSREEDAWLSDGQLAQCAAADETDAYGMPIPTQIVSNGEYMPPPQTEGQKRVEARTLELADGAAKKLGVSRRQFLAGSGGMAAALLAMNEVYGSFFRVSESELYEAAAFADSAPPKDLFVLDDQLHMVRGSRPSPAGLRAIAQGPTSAPRITSNPYNQRKQKDELGDEWSNWNPALIGLPIDAGYAHITQFIKDVYLDSQVTIGLLSNVTASAVQVDGESRPPRNAEEAQRGEILTAAQT